MDKDTVSILVSIKLNKSMLLVHNGNFYITISSFNNLCYIFCYSYVKISHIYSKFLKIWPAYVHWARGNLRLAANAFASEIENCEGENYC